MTLDKDQWNAVIKRQKRKYWDINTQYFTYYMDFHIRHKIISYIKDHELALLTKDEECAPKSIRYIRCHHQEYLFKQVLSQTSFRLGIPFNLYKSVAKYQDGIPSFPLNMMKRKNEYDKDITDWSQNHYKSITGYDFYIDIDAPDDPEGKYWTLVVDSVKGILADLNAKKVPYSLYFSGNGYHIKIAYDKEVFGEEFDGFSEQMTVYKMMQAFAQKYYDNVSELVDMKIYDSRRIIKVPYSMVIYPYSPDTKKIYISLPVNDITMLERFKRDDYCLDKMKVKEYLDKFPEDVVYNKDGDVRNLIR